jgi:hypothetical protein
MTDLRLVPRATKIEGGRWRPEVLVYDSWGGENVFRGGLAASQDAALEAAQRLIVAAAVEPVTRVELPPAWKISGP